MNALFLYSMWRCSPGELLDPRSAFLGPSMQAFAGAERWVQPSVGYRPAGEQSADLVEPGVVGAPRQRGLDSALAAVDASSQPELAPDVALGFLTPPALGPAAVADILAVAFELRLYKSTKSLLSGYASTIWPAITNASSRFPVSICKLGAAAWLYRESFFEERGRLDHQFVLPAWPSKTRCLRRGEKSAPEVERFFAVSQRFQRE